MKFNGPAFVIVTIVTDVSTSIEDHQMAVWITVIFHGKFGMIGYEKNSF